MTIAICAIGPERNQWRELIDLSIRAESVEPLKGILDSLDDVQVTGVLLDRLIHHWGLSDPVHAPIF